MLASKFDLYKAGWLDLVFENRNKNYGAYYLRQHYADNMVRAMVVTFLGLLMLFGLTVILRPANSEDHATVVDITPPAVIQPPPVQPIKKIEPPAPVKSIKPQTPAPTVATQIFVPPVVVKDQDATAKVVQNKDLTGTIGQVDTKGKSGENLMPTETTGTGTTPVEDNTPRNLGELDFMPQPIGGESAWAKFLNKNLRYPISAQEEGINGKVILSFIIEKDGHLSNIVVERAAGHGFDEEAMRVLKMAKAWKPGMQNGQPVRVRYAIPINFQLSSE
jgi:protein TonB